MASTFIFEIPVLTLGPDASNAVSSGNTPSVSKTSAGNLVLVVGTFLTADGHCFATETEMPILTDGITYEAHLYQDIPGSTVNIQIGAIKSTGLTVSTLPVTPITIVSDPVTWVTTVNWQTFNSTLLIESDAVTWEAKETSKTAPVIISLICNDVEFSSEEESDINEVAISIVPGVLVGASATYILAVDIPISVGEAKNEVSAQYIFNGSMPIVLDSLTYITEYPSATAAVDMEISADSTVWTSEEVSEVLYSDMGLTVGGITAMAKHVTYASVTTMPITVGDISRTYLPTYAFPDGVDMTISVRDISGYSYFLSEVASSFVGPTATDSLVSTSEAVWEIAGSTIGIITYIPYSSTLPTVIEAAMTLVAGDVLSGSHNILGVANTNIPIAIGTLSSNGIVLSSTNVSNITITVNSIRSSSLEKSYIIESVMPIRSWGVATGENLSLSTVTGGELYLQDGRLYSYEGTFNPLLDSRVVGVRLPLSVQQIHSSSVIPDPTANPSVLSIVVGDIGVVTSSKVAASNMSVVVDNPMLAHRYCAVSGSYLPLNEIVLWETDPNIPIHLEIAGITIPIVPDLPIIPSLQEFID